MTAEPRWIRSVAVPGWPVERVHLHDLEIAVAVPVGWAIERPGAAGPIVVHRGHTAVEVLAVQLIDDADESRPLSDWMAALLAIGGFPVPELVVGDDAPPPRLVEWTDHGPAADLARDVGADDSRLYHGLAVVTAPELARLYTVLLRRGARAWRLALSFASACPPGAPSDLVDANDHVRAAATFGGVELG